MLLLLEMYVTAKYFIEPLYFPTQVSYSSVSDSYQTVLHVYAYFC